MVRIRVECKYCQFWYDAFNNGIAECHCVCGCIIDRNEEREPIVATRMGFYRWAKKEKAQKD